MFMVTDTNNIPLAIVPCRDDLKTCRSLTSDEARRIAKAITRLPEFLMQRQIPKQARSFFYLESQPDRVEVEA